MRTNRTAAILLTTAVLLAGCGDDDDEPAATTDEGVTLDEGGGPSDDEANEGASGPGVYVWEDEVTGATARFTIPAPEDDPKLQEILAFKAEAGASGPVTVITAEFDNTDGSEQASLPTLNIVTQDGEQIEFNDAWLLVGDWQNAMDVSSDAYNDGVDLYNSMLNQDSLLPGAKTTAYLAAAVEMPEIKGVFADGEALDQE